MITARCCERPPLPLSPAHSDDDIGDAIDALRRVYARFTARDQVPGHDPGPGP